MSDACLCPKLTIFAVDKSETYNFSPFTVDISETYHILSLLRSISLELTTFLSFEVGKFETYNFFLLWSVSPKLAILSSFAASKSETYHFFLCSWYVRNLPFLSFTVGKFEACHFIFF